MHGLRHYEARLRWSRRTPYVVARRLGAIAIVAALVFVVNQDRGLPLVVCIVFGLALAF